MTNYTPQALEKLSQSIAWDGSNLALTDAKAMSMVNKQHLSPSSYLAMRGCSAQFASSRALPDTPHPMAANALGTSMHTSMERFYDVDIVPKGARNKSRLTKLVAEILEEEAVKYPEFFADEVSRASWTTEVLGRALNIFTLEKPTKIDVIENEKKVFGVQVGVTPFYGVIDRIDRLPDGGKRLADYKSGKAQVPWQYGSDDHGDQLRIYHLAMEALTGETPAASQIIYFKNGGKVQPVSLAQDQLDRTKKDFDRSFELLRSRVDNNAFPTKTSVLCGWCPLVNLCPSAQKEGKTDRTEGQTAVPGGAVLIPTIGMRPGSSTDKPKKKDKAPVEVESIEPTGDDLWQEKEEKPKKTGKKKEKESTPPWEDEPKMSKKTKSKKKAKDNPVDVRLEDKPFFETATSALGNEYLNFNSYAASGAFGTVSLAMTVLHQNNVEPTGPRVKYLTSLFGGVLDAAYKKITLSDTTDWQSGAHTRVRGALRTVMETGLPVPLGRPARELLDWHDAAVKRVVAIAGYADHLWAGTLTGDPDVLTSLELEDK